MNSLEPPPRDTPFVVARRVGPAPSPIALHRHTDLPHPERRVARGEHVRVLRGVYAEATPWADLAPWHRYLARVHAAAMLHPDAVFSHESAAALSNLPVVGDPVTVHVLAAASAASRTISGVCAHTTHGEREVIERGGILFTSPVETAVDIARQRHPTLGLAVADAALRQLGHNTADLLVSCNEGRLSSRGRDLARWPLSRANAAAESTLESFSRAVVEWLGFPLPTLQRVFSSPEAVDRTDFFWDEFSVIGEADGDMKYDGSFGDPLSALRARRMRDIRLGRHARTIVHWGWTEATTFAPLRNALLGAGLPLVAPEASAALFSLRRRFAPRSSDIPNRREYN